MPRPELTNRCIPNPLNSNNFLHSQDSLMNSIGHSKFDHIYYISRPLRNQVHYSHKLDML